MQRNSLAKDLRGYLELYYTPDTRPEHAGELEAEGHPPGYRVLLETLLVFSPRISAGQRSEAVKAIIARTNQLLAAAGRRLSDYQIERSFIGIREEHLAAMAQAVEESGFPINTRQHIAQLSSAL